MSVCSRINTLAWLEHNRQIVSIYKGVFKYIACMLCSLLLLKMKKVAIFGDSHVWRLGAFCNEDLKVPMEVRFFGAGGMKASKPKPGLLKQVKMYRADLVVVSLGCNDITTASVPKDIVAAVLDIAQSVVYLPSWCWRLGSVEHSGTGWGTGLLQARAHELTSCW
ncbi:uncharacterized protein LOC128246865 [Mya arenaria]|uniref:uncharacterized protein LOC128203192 n=1 Tax=Mya arenaria TaxID=6604 RepID=UPI0022DF4601|nr:uncharacterized protein LOC128203192 [Mya arenaria]XP_052821319.1 uncharacterized protein LOC128246865 [Mya arenaria]